MTGQRDIFGTVGGITREDLVEQRSDRVDIGPGADRALIGAGLFWRHVGRSAHHGSISGDDGRSLLGGCERIGDDILEWLIFDVGKDPRQAPVHQIDLTKLTHHDIGRFDIAMNDSARVGILEGIANLQQNFQ